MKGVCNRGHVLTEVGFYEYIVDGRVQRQCKPCRLRQSREYASRPEVVARRRERDGDETALARQRIRSKERDYGISRDEFVAMVEAQRGLCAICDQPERTRGNSGNIRPLSVDHDHETGFIRGLLCNRCNRALGLFLDDLGLVEAARDYLRSALVRQDVAA